MIGYAQIKLKNYKESIVYLNKSIELNPAFSESYFNRGIAMLHLNNLKSAIKDFDIIIESNPEYDFVYYFRGKAKFKSRNKKDACKDWLKAIQYGYDDKNHFIKKKCKKYWLKE